MLKDSTLFRKSAHGGIVVNPTHGPRIECRTANNYAVTMYVMLKYIMLWEYNVKISNLVLPFSISVPYIHIVYLTAANEIRD
jgi:hypothetical protein